MGLSTETLQLTEAVRLACIELRTKINGNAVDLSSLTTTAKGNLVAAINELKGDLGGISSAWEDLTGKPTAVTALAGTNTGDQDLSGLLTVSTAVNTFAPLQDPVFPNSIWVDGNIESVVDITCYGSINAAGGSIAAGAFWGNGSNITGITTDIIADSGATGRAVVQAETPSAALTELGAGAEGKLLLATATQAAALTELGKRVYHLEDTQTVDSSAGVFFPGLGITAISLKPNTHYAISGWYRLETINASFDFEITGATNPTFDFDATEANFRNSIFVSPQAGTLDAYSVQSVTNFRIAHSGITVATRKSRALFYGFFLTTSAATTLGVRLRNRGSTGTVAIRDGIIIFEELP